MVWITLRVLAALGGVLALYLAIFMYEDEEGALQDRVDQLWVQIHDRKQRSHQRIVSFLSTAGEALNKGLDRLFGSKLISLQAASISMCYSMAGLYLITFQSDSFVINRHWNVLTFFLLVYLGSMPAIF